MGETFNIGSGVGVTIKEVVDIISKIINIKPIIESDFKRIRPKASEVDRLVCDNKKIKNLIGFKHTFTLEEGLINTIKWMSNPKNLELYKTNIYNV